ncbi:MAG: radical SAM protein, partial [Paludibacteraceae bacterium]|nr:radical SAM protein [Paludibacteraceae bacterium]
MEPLLGKTLQELQDIAESVGLPRFAGKQLAQWLYVKRVSSFDGMSNISLQGRAALAAQYTIGRTAPVREAVSADGTRKYLFRLSTGEYIETVYIPESERATLCVSTQAGCKMGCRFCMTGTLGFHGHLQAADILNQILYFDDLTNVVFMGEGEPMDNLDNVLRSLHILTADYGCAWSPKRITVSTVGIPAMKRFLDESECHLAISMHNPFPKERTE